MGFRVCGVLGKMGSKLKMGSGFCCLMGVELRDCFDFFFGVLSPKSIEKFKKKTDFSSTVATSNTDFE